MAYRRLAHYNGDAVVTPAKVSLTARGDRARKGFRIRIKNLDTTDDLEISFDGGAHFYPIWPAEELAMPANFHYFFVRASAGTVPYRAIVAQG